uniref:Uncharacterized protein n=1 Tax=viral metagenome TaxID=1070528 RepID=A0A6C0D0A5_9ZZZZ
MNNSDDENYDNDYDDYDEDDLSQFPSPPFPSHYRFDDQYFKMPSIPRVRQYTNGREYIIITYDTHQIFRGTFDNWNSIDEFDEEYYTTYYHMPNRKYANSFTNYYFTCNNKKYMFNDCDYYYEVHLFIDQIKRRAENARQQMEKRSLNMILKRVVNEEFQW